MEEGLVEKGKEEEFPRLILVEWPTKNQLVAQGKNALCERERNLTMFEKNMFPLLPSFRAAKEEYVRVCSADPEFYGPFEAYSEIFYRRLMAKIIDGLVGHVYTEQELDKKVPYIDAPHYSREAVMHQYLQRMLAMKSRGEEWETRCAILKSLLPIHLQHV